MSVKKYGRNGKYAFHSPGAALVCLVLAICSGCTTGKDPGSTGSPKLLDNNLRCVDLSDLTGELPLHVVSTKQILHRSEDWEIPTWKNPQWPEPNGADDVGFPTVVKNDRGRNPDGNFYLYYSHHDPSGGIGLAIAEKIDGPYIKLAARPGSGRQDSQVLSIPHFPAKPDDSSHYSSPVVVWNEDEQLWFMYFHFWNNSHFQWRKTMKQGFGHQMTALATTADLSSHDWTVWEDHKVPTNPPLRPVLPSTSARWMNSQSSYHAVQRLPNGQWLAFLRGTGGELDKSAPGGWRQDRTALGFATSRDGRHWTCLTQNPVLHEADGGGGRQGDYAPDFVGYLGKNARGEDEYLLVWNESGKVRYGKTRDFMRIERDPRGYANWPSYGGSIAAWRLGNRLYIFTGRFVHEMVLPVSSRGV